MNTKLGGLFGLSLIVAMIAGCGGYDDALPPVAAKPNETVAPPAAKQEPAAKPAAKPAAAAPATPKEPPTVTEKAKGGMGAGSKTVGPGGGILTTPISSYFYITERLAFDLVTHALDLFKGAEGRWPKDEAEFNERIIKENQIKLPKLPEGHSYFYDPEKGQLMIRHPAEG